MKIAIGMITKTLRDEPLRFLENAKKFGHSADAVIATYSHGMDEDSVRQISNIAPCYPINLADTGSVADELMRRGIRRKSYELLLNCPMLGEVRHVPYGFSRNIVLIAAIQRGFDAIVFVDSDVYPSVLRKTDGKTSIEEVDFLGAHMRALCGGSQISTSEYSGYNILPPCDFDDMDALLLGVRKGDMLEYWQSSSVHRCLALQTQDGDAVPTAKILGGNVAFLLSVFSCLPPFFSTYYRYGGEYLLARGEDTQMSPAIKRTNTVCTDIKLNLFHDTYKNYPREPDLKNCPDTQNRFYYAITGWIGRNPLLNYLLGRDTDEVRETERPQLVKGAKSLAEYTGNPRYLALPEIFDASWNELPRYIDEYNRYTEAWFEFIERSDLR